jgi:hypothetical protein
MPAAAADSWTDLVLATRQELSDPTCENPSDTCSAPPP